MAAPRGTYPRRSSQSCARFPCWGNAGAPGVPARAQRDLGMDAGGIRGWMRGWGCDKHGPRKLRGPGTSSCEGSGRFVPLGASSFLFSQLEMRAPLSGGGESRLGVSLAPSSPWADRGARGPGPGQGCGRPAGLCEGWAAPAVTDHR